MGHSPATYVRNGTITSGNDVFDEVATDEQINKAFEYDDEAKKHRRRAREAKETKERFQKRIAYENSSEHRERMEELRKEAPDFRVVQIEETRFWDEEIVEEAGRIWGVWYFDAQRGVHTASLSRSFELFRLDTTTLHRVCDDTHSRIMNHQWEPEIQYISTFEVDKELCLPEIQGPFVEDWVEKYHEIIEGKAEKHDDPEEEFYKSHVDNRFELLGNPFWDVPQVFLDSNLNPTELSR